MFPGMSRHHYSMEVEAFLATFKIFNFDIYFIGWGIQIYNNTSAVR